MQNMRAFVFGIEPEAQPVVFDSKAFIQFPSKAAWMYLLKAVFSLFYHCFL